MILITLFRLCAGVQIAANTRKILLLKQGFRGVLKSLKKSKIKKSKF